MVQDVPPIIVESAFVVKGGLLCKDSKVALTTVIVDDVKHNCIQIRKRDFWSYGPFIGRKVAATQKDRISNTVKLIGAKFRKAVLDKRKETMQKEQEALDQELKAADSGRQELGISDSEDDAHATDEDELRRWRRHAQLSVEARRARREVARWRHPLDGHRHQW